MQQAHTQGDPYITRREAAQLLGVSNRTINRWIDKGVIKVWKTAGGQSRIYRSSVEALLAERDTPEISTDVRTILVVEDDPAMREFVSIYLESLELPIRVITASNGYEGLIIIGQESPDLIITDLMMPGMDGIEMIRCMREGPVPKNTVIVAMTMLDEDEIRDLGGLPDDVRLLKKPIQTEELAEVVDACF